MQEWIIYHYDVMGENIGIKWNIYMETLCFRVFMLLKVYVSMYIFHLRLTFSPQMVNALLL